jgi:hypothetical protein
MQVEPTPAEVVKTGLTVASCMNHIRNNRIEYLIVTMLMYSIGAIDKALTYGQNMCL